MENISKQHKLKYMESNTHEWERLANNLARSWVPINACRNCGRPVVEGYCCGFCKSENP